MNIEESRFSPRFLTGILSALVLGIAFGLAAAPALAEGEITRVVFASGPDDTGTVQNMVDGFNVAHAGRIEVTWREMDRDNTAHHQQLVKEFTGKVSVSHVIASDVVWTAEFAEKGWVQDVSRQFNEAYDRSAFLGPALRSATYQLRLWGVPWYTDASFLFYRKDLLAKNGFDAAPRTWDELIEMSSRIMTASGIRFGYVFQGAEYEGGAANAAEYIWGAGGELTSRGLRVTSAPYGSVAETDTVTIKSVEAASGLDLARRLIAEGIVPAEVTTYRELESLNAFLAGDAIFLRSWPYVQGMLKSSMLSTNQVGVSLLPATSTKNIGYSCLGGWNLMISARASAAERAAAWKFIRYLTAPAQQKRQALEAGLLPIIESLYDDPQILDAVPVAALARETMSSRIGARPVTPFYAEISSQIANAFHRVLEGKITGTEAVEELDSNLRGIVTRNR